MSRDSKTKIVSLSLEPEMHEAVKDAAKRLGHKNVSQVMRDLVSKFLPLLVNDGDEIPIIIRVPGDLTEKPDALRAWLRAKSEAIADALS